MYVVAVLPFVVVTVHSTVVCCSTFVTFVITVADCHLFSEILCDYRLLTLPVALPARCHHYLMIVMESVLHLCRFWPLLMTWYRADHWHCSVAGDLRWYRAGDGADAIVLRYMRWRMQFVTIRSRGDAGVVITRYTFGGLITLFVTYGGTIVVTVYPLGNCGDTMVRWCFDWNDAFVTGDFTICSRWCWFTTTFFIRLYGTCSSSAWYCAGDFCSLFPMPFIPVHGAEYFLRIVPVDLLRTVPFKIRWLYVILLRCVDLHLLICLLTDGICSIPTFIPHWVLLFWCTIRDGVIAVLNSTGVVFVTFVVCSFDVPLPTIDVDCCYVWWWTLFFVGVHSWWWWCGGVNFLLIWWLPFIPLFAFLFTFLNLQMLFHSLLLFWNYDFFDLIPMLMYRITIICCCWENDSRYYPFVYTFCSHYSGVIPSAPPFDAVDTRHSSIAEPFCAGVVLFVLAWLPGDCAGTFLLIPFYDIGGTYGPSTLFVYCLFCCIRCYPLVSLPFRRDYGMLGTIRSAENIFDSVRFSVIVQVDVTGGNYVHSGDYLFLSDPLCLTIVWAIRSSDADSTPLHYRYYGTAFILLNAWWYDRVPPRSILLFLLFLPTLLVYHSPRDLVPVADYAFVWWRWRSLLIRYGGAGDWCPFTVTFHDLAIVPSTAVTLRWSPLRLPVRITDVDVTTDDLPGNFTVRTVPCTGLTFFTCSVDTGVIIGTIACVSYIAIVLCSLFNTTTGIPLHYVTIPSFITVRRRCSLFAAVHSLFLTSSVILLLIWIVPFTVWI